ncbi:hypothetical protein [Kamptonema formosum]|uniref:hypothetical protein n=1 Tax=Kamptonema formosum TaxID=331992 RepID=UPI0018E28D9C|nr:hypothetical protein [Oscillatoria sp. PCC 10802]
MSWCESLFDFCVSIGRRAGKYARGSWKILKDASGQAGRLSYVGRGGTWGPAGTGGRWGQRGQAGRGDRGGTGGDRRDVGTGGDRGDRRDACPTPGGDAGASFKCQFQTI